MINEYVFQSKQKKTFAKEPIPGGLVRNTNMAAASLFGDTNMAAPTLRANTLYNALYRVFSRDVTAAMLVSLNKGVAAMLVSQTNPPGIELCSYGNVFFCFG